MEKKKYFNWKLFGTIYLTLFIPVIYRTLRFFFIGTLPDSNSFTIASNLQWINVLFEVLEEGFLLPLFFVLRAIITEKNNEIRNRKIVFQLLIISAIYLFFIIIFVSLSEQLLDFMSVQNVTKETIKFVRIEFFSRFFMMIIKLGTILLIAQGLWKQLIFALFITTTCNVLLDLLIVSNYAFSLKQGVIWIAYNQLIISLVMALFYLLLIFAKYQFTYHHLKPKIFFEKSNWMQHLFAGLESFIRNAFFIWFVIKTINKLDNTYNQSDFWVMNGFIWDWLLLPILALSQFLNRDQAFNYEQSFKSRLKIPLIIVLITISIWFCLIPTYEPFIRVILNNSNSKLIANLVLISLGFYLLFALNEPLDKIMYGDGKAQYILLQSVIVNIGVYIPYYLLTTNMTINDVAIMMGSAIALDALITIIIFIIVYHKKLFIKKEKRIILRS